MEVSSQLLKNAQRGDRKSQYELYQLCFPALMGISLRYKNNRQDAVSAVNSGFLKIIQKLDRFRPEMPFEGWMKRVMVNTLIDEYRSERRWREVTHFSDNLEQHLPDEPHDWNEADLRFNAEQLEALLRRLPPTTQQVFNLFALDGFSHAEIGAMLHISEGTSKWHVSAARKQLQAWLHEATVKVF